MQIFITLSSKIKGLIPNKYQIPNKIGDKGFFKQLITLRNLAEAIGKDFVYHQFCWVYKQREANKNDEPYEENADYQIS